MSASDTSAGVKVSPASEPAAGKAKVKVAPPPASSSKATVEPDISDSSAADYESLLWTCKECYIYKIPPLKNESGHRANDWNVNEWLWQGALKVTSKGNTLIIVLHDPKTFEIFATCPQKEKGNGAIDRVIDSSRYYVLRLDDGKGNHAFVGLGFREREDSYDFNATMQDHWKSIARQKEAEEMAKEASEKLSSMPMRDLSLKDGEKLNIKVNVPGASGKPRAPRQKSEGNGLLPPPPAGGLLPPPPKAGALAPPPAKGTTTGAAAVAPPPPPSARATTPAAPVQPAAPTAAAAAPATDADDGFGDFGDFTHATPGSAEDAGDDDDFGDFQ